MTTLTVARKTDTDTEQTDTDGFKSVKIVF